MRRLRHAWAYRNAQFRGPCACCVLLRTITMNGRVDGVSNGAHSYQPCLSQGFAIPRRRQRGVLQGTGRSRPCESRDRPRMNKQVMSKLGFYIISEASAVDACFMMLAPPLHGSKTFCRSEFHTQNHRIHRPSRLDGLGSRRVPIKIP